MVLMMEAVMEAMMGVVVVTTVVETSKMCCLNLLCCGFSYDFASVVLGNIRWVTFA